MSLRRGGVTVGHTVWCARARNVGEEDLPFTPRSTYDYPHGCVSHYQYEGHLRETLEAARRQGWVRTPVFGWLCEPCYAAYQEWKANKK
jgi:hypothetical protein